ncbi:MAG: exodeoxyribonuclease VII small subunit [Chitinophagales bacterium]|jgi:exodeoxyribonuclease VII small subunit|tara:strand:- start:3843 stop:4085 length:243 start_codon:yes stop_codon:yes gene_type:complete
MVKAKSNPNFEDTLSELEAIVQQLEVGDLSLEESLKAFEHGVNLTKNCQDSLNKAEQKIQTLIEKQGNIELKPFTEADED